MTNKPIALLPISSLVLAAGCLAGQPTTDDDATEAASSQQALTAPIAPHAFPPACNPPMGLLCPVLSQVALSSSASASLTYASLGCFNQCELSWASPSSGPLGSEPWPVNTSGTTGANPGLVYTLTCGEVLNGCTLYTVSASATVL